MDSSYKCKQRWRTKAKAWIIRYCGGCCQVCGYKRCFRNLDLHHLDSDQKENAISSLVRDTHGWVEIMAELTKCVLVCKNCHGEIHEGLINSPIINNDLRVGLLAEILAERPIPKNHQSHTCKCGVRFIGDKQYCSVICSHRYTERIVWPTNLIELVGASSKRAVAQELGVSDKAVAKRLKNHVMY